MTRLLQRKATAKDVLRLALNPPSRIINFDFMVLYFVVAAFPNLVVLSVALLMESNEPVFLPEIWRSVSGVTLAPLIETLVFFVPIRWLLKKQNGFYRWTILAGTAAVFSACHYIFEDRSVWVAFMPFWAGLIMAHAYDISQRLKTSSFWLITGIHALYNATAISFTYAVFLIAQVIQASEVRWCVLASFELTVLFLMGESFRRIGLRYQNSPVHGGQLGMKLPL